MKVPIQPGHGNNLSSEWEKLLVSFKGAAASALGLEEHKV